MDIMHVFFEGIARQNLGALCYVICNKWGSSPFDIVHRLADYAKEKGIPQSEFSRVNTSRAKHLAEGQEGGRPSGECSFPGTAMQIAKVILHVDGIFGPLLNAEQKEHPVWQMALLTCRISRLLWQRSFTTANILELDKCIWLHDSIMLGTPLLQHLWKPKNHYLSHVPLEILWWAPPRNYWCIPFEHENQLIKGGATHSNFSNVLWSCADEKALGVALEAYKRGYRGEF